MADKILLKRAGTPGKVPAAGDLTPGELAVNTADGKLFTKQDDGTVKEIGGPIAWGTVTGVIADQTDLQSALDGKVGTADTRLTDSREWTADTVTQAEAEEGTATTRRAWTAQRVRQAIVAWWISVSSAWGRGFVGSADAAAGRTALELGTAATRTALGTTGALYSRDSILGQVSQSGGVPTGAIIERGINANGEYVRFADGAMICWLGYSVANIVNTSVYNIQDVTVYRNDYTWIFPSAFSPTYRVSVVSSVTQNISDSFVSSFPSGISASSVTLMSTSLYSWVSFARINVSAIAIGRWY